jgi:hypothetical protein
VNQRELAKVVAAANSQHRSRLELTGIEKVGLSLIVNDILLWAIHLEVVPQT